ncbi:MAG: two-component sensor histidine kinase [Cellvibrionaceae bacterium]|nr:two-component sensor histidine kinase [Cellvibrionaceae bacterium]|tara:strand:- start:29848 stop:31308 length:1461 start_codon:yes stop_codon:yes gene_type:complete
MKLIKKLWPQKLLTQMIVLVVLALLLAQGISTWLLSKAYQNQMIAHSERHFSRQFGAMIRLLEQAPAELHPAVLKAWKRPGVSYRFSQQLPPDLRDQPQRYQSREKRVIRLMERKLGDSYRGRITVRLELVSPNDRQRPPAPDARKPFPPREDGFRRPALEPHNSSPASRFRPRGMPLKQLMLAVKLDNGQWFVAHSSAPDFSLLASRQTLNFVVIACVLVLLVVIFQIRKITRPLSSLAIAANNLGRGRKVEPLPEVGPNDVKETVAAFNRMNDRLQRFVSDRTRMLAALSHDLRTPMTSMRLRLELMQDSDEKQRLLQSLDEMQQMSEATLTFVRHSGDVEPTQTVDLTALVDSLVEDLCEIGLAVQCDSLTPVVMELRPVSIKRALRNLMENAVHYGDKARVNLSLDKNQAVISIIDSGPGITESEKESVFEPFVRLEQSRNRQTGGMGLGLSIARQIIRSHGGELELVNLQPGLKAVVTLPI